MQQERSDSEAKQSSTIDRAAVESPSQKGEGKQKVGASVAGKKSRLKWPLAYDARGELVTPDEAAARTDDKGEYGFEFARGGRIPLVLRGGRGKDGRRHFAIRRGSCSQLLEELCNVGMSTWHLLWQCFAKPECREVRVADKRADIRTPAGVTIEIQRSPISAADVLQRNLQHGRTVWLIDAQTASLSVLGASQTTVQSTPGNQSTSLDGDRLHLGLGRFAARSVLEASMPVRDDDVSSWRAVERAIDARPDSVNAFFAAFRAPDHTRTNNLSRQSTVSDLSATDPTRTHNLSRQSTVSDLSATDPTRTHNLSRQSTVPDLSATGKSSAGSTITDKLSGCGPMTEVYLDVGEERHVFRALERNREVLIVEPVPIERFIATVYADARELPARVTQLLALRSRLLRIEGGSRPRTPTVDQMLAMGWKRAHNDLYASTLQNAPRFRPPTVAADDVSRRDESVPQGQSISPGTSMTLGQSISPAPGRARTS